ncbi:MAG: sodium:proton antiporter [Nocardioidaceae bacterium]|nr:sodium:proton antiporter [Nocardioidaceae bacterium]
MTGSETPSPERIDRNWAELLQELRVTQTGVQILTGFLLTIPFSARFESLDEMQRTVYLCVLSGSMLATALLVAPVVYHRVLFRQRQRVWLVAAGNRSAKAGMVALAATVSGVTWLVFDVVVGRTAGLLALGVASVAFVVLWWRVPLVLRRR